MVKSELAPRSEPVQEKARARKYTSILLGWKNTGIKLDADNDVYPTEAECVGKDFPVVHISSSEDALGQLFQLRKNIDPNTYVGNYLNKAITATITFCDEERGHARHPFRDYVEKTIGIEPTMIPEEELLIQERVRDRAFRRAGFSPSVEEYKRYFEARLDKDSIKDEFTTARDKLVPLTAELLDLSHMLPLEYDESIESLEKARWNFRLMLTRDGAVLVINTHENIRWNPGRPEELVVHELVGHLMRYLLWKENVASGKISEAYGTMQMAGPASWQDEGLACTLPYFLPEVYRAMSPTGRFMVEAYHLQRMVYNNAHIMINEGATFEDVKNYVWQYLPYETDARLERQLDTRLNNPFQRTYQLAYGDGVHYFRNLARELTPEQRIAFVKACFQKPMTPDQVKELAAYIKATV